MVMITWYRELSSVDFSATNYSDFCPKWLRQEDVPKAYVSNKAICIDF